LHYFSIFWHDGVQLGFKFPLKLQLVFLCIFKILSGLLSSRYQLLFYSSDFDFEKKIEF